MPTISDCVFIALVATPIDCALSVVKAVRRALWSRQRGYAVWVPGEGGVSWHEAKYPMQAIDKEMQRRRLGVESAWDLNSRGEGILSSDCCLFAFDREGHPQRQVTASE